jgi:hypothetical protein
MVMKQQHGQAAYEEVKSVLTAVNYS